MRIYKLAAYVQEFTGGNPPEFDGTEAIRLKDGRTFYCASINHYPIIQYLKRKGINYTQFDTIGWLDPDGVLTPGRKGRGDIETYMGNPGW